MTSPNSPTLRQFLGILALLLAAQFWAPARESLAASPAPPDHYDLLILTPQEFKLLVPGRSWQP